MYLGPMIILAIIWKKYHKSEVDLEWIYVINTVKLKWTSEKSNTYNRLSYFFKNNCEVQGITRLHVVLLFIYFKNA